MLNPLRSPFFERKYWSIIFCALTLSCSAYADWALLPADSHPIKARFETPERLVVIGDIHADDRALITILQSSGLVDEQLKWIGGKAVLVSMGDLVDRGPNSKLVMDIIMRLQNEAQQVGGSVVVLQSNHAVDLARGKLDYFNPKDVDHYCARGGALPWQECLREVFRTSKYAEWIAEHPTAVIIGDTLFVHAGLENWAGQLDIDRLNSTIRAWVLFYQGRGPRPLENTQWVSGGNGPLESRRLVAGAVPIDDLKRWLAGIGVQRVVVGHTKIDPASLLKPHPTYGTLVLMSDTGISMDRPRSLTAIEFSPTAQPRQIAISLNKCTVDLVSD